MSLELLEQYMCLRNYWNNICLQNYWNNECVSRTTGTIRVSLELLEQSLEKKNVSGTTGTVVHPVPVDTRNHGSMIPATGKAIPQEGRRRRVDLEKLVPLSVSAPAERPCPPHPPPLPRVFRRATAWFQPQEKGRNRHQIRVST